MKWNTCSSHHCHASVNNTAMLPFVSAILLMYVRTGEMMDNAIICQKTITFVVFTTAISLDLLDFPTKDIFNFLFEFNEYSEILRLLTLRK